MEKQPPALRWKTLVHSGPCVEENKKIGLSRPGPRLWIRGKQLDKRLSPRAESLAMEYASISNNKNKKQFDDSFHANFWHDWASYLPSSVRIRIRNFPRDCDFREFTGFPVRPQFACAPGPSSAIVDGQSVSIGNRYAERTGIFKGRKAHQRGRVKVGPSWHQITLNLSHEAPIPARPWGSIVHDPSADWLAAWRDSLTGRMKYMRLAADAPAHQTSDREKFDRIRSLLLKFDPASLDLGTQQGLILRLLWECAFRVGGISSSENEDTDGFGATSLKLLHVRLPPAPVKKDAPTQVSFNFRGKDGVPYIRTVELPMAVVSALRKRIKQVGMNQDARIFSECDALCLNKYIRDNIGIDFTAKDFRTLRACTMYEGILFPTSDAASNGRKFRVTLDYANACVAHLLNHRSGSSSSSQDDTQRELDESFANGGGDLANVIKRNGLILTTSRSNYIDPCITSRFCRGRGEPVERAWRSLAERKKFAWAIERHSRNETNRKYNK